MNVPNVVTNGRNEYLQILDEAWLKHLEPKRDDAPMVISLFAGCGGSSLGYSMAGFKELLAVDCDKNAIATFRLNFPNVRTWLGDIRKLSVEQCMEMTNIQTGELDLLDGSPPCQGFSTAGKRILEDERNYLFKEYLRFLSGLKPKTFIMENVSGMVKGKMKLLFSQIIKELKNAGYNVSCKLMDAKYFCVPQTRKRLIFLGVRKDMNANPAFPGPQHWPFTVYEAINDYPDGLNQGEFQGPLLKVARRMKPGQKGDKAVIRRRYFNFVRLKWNEPSVTICNRVCTPKTTWCSGLIHPDYQRHLNIAELKRLQSFPDGFQLVGRFRTQWGLIGNSVPPLFMKAIAEHVRRAILKK